MFQAFNSARESGLLQNDFSTSFVSNLGSISVHSRKSSNWTLCVDGNNFSLYDRRKFSAHVPVSVTHKILEHIKSNQFKPFIFGKKFQFHRYDFNSRYQAFSTPCLTYL